MWLVGGTVQYARLTRDQWADRIRLAKLAGLNTITTSVVWARHEPRPGTFDFAGDNDLRHFVQLVGQAGMHCVLRVGPYVGDGFDFGGLPPWVLGLKDVQIRTASQSFLEACSRFFGAVAKQVRDLQVTVPQQPGDTHGGPIVLVQNEHQWVCGGEARATAYLGELNRYVRESGFEVPIINTNNLWQGVEGEIDTWHGREELLGFMRQLATVRPNQPRMVGGLPTGELGAWGEDEPRALTVRELEQRLLEVLAGAAQFNIEPFAGGTNFAFSAGRLAGGQARWATTDAGCGAMVDSSGRRTELYQPMRVIATFASRFARLLSHLDARAYAIGLHPGEVLVGPGSAKSAGARRAKRKGADSSARSHAVMHASGSQGSVVFVFAGEGLADEPATLLLSNGTQLPVYLSGPEGGVPAAWCPIDTRLFGRSHLDYCNLSALAMVGRVFVCFGPAGTPAKFSINGSPLELEVPTGDAPTVVEHENIVLVIASPAHLPTIQITDDEVLLGAVDVTPAGEPVAASAKGVVTRVRSGGEVVKAKVGEKVPVPGVVAPAPVVVAPVAKGKGAKAKAGKKGAPEPVVEVAPFVPPTLPVVVAPAPVRSARPIELGPWTGADMVDHAAGSSARYASIAGPAELSNLGAPYGYGWYKLVLRGASAGRTELGWPHSADRLHLFLDGKPAGVIGRGPGASPTLGVTLRKREQTLVVLAENLGRFSEGAHMVDLKGCYGHAWELAPAKGVSKPQLVRETQMPVLSLPGFIPGLHDGDVTEAQRVTWTLAKRRGPLVLRLPAMGLRGIVLVNGAPVRTFDDTGPGELFIDEEKLGKGQVTVQIAVTSDPVAALKKLAEHAEFVDALVNLTQDAEWAFAKWERPADSAFRPLRGHAHGKVPEWFRTTFAGVPGASLSLSVAGLSKGQVYVNGRHVGRYFASTHEGKTVGPQIEIVLPPSVLRAGGEGNELLIFDEHGHLPSKCRLFAR